MKMKMNNEETNLSTEKNNELLISTNKFFIKINAKQSIELNIIKNKLTELNFFFVDEKKLANHILYINISDGKRLNNICAGKEDVENYKPITLVDIKYSNLDGMNVCEELFKVNSFIFYVDNSDCLEAKILVILEQYILKNIKYIAVDF